MKDREASAPRPVRAPATDALILTVAAERLRLLGVRNVTIVDIARVCGMSHANIYRYFPSKSALLEEITAVWLRPIEAEARMIAEGPDPAPDKFERVLFSIHRAYRDKLDKDPVLFDLLANEAAANRGVARKHRGRLQNIVQRILEEGFTQASFQHADLRRAMEVVFDLSHRFLHPSSIALDREVSRASVDQRAARLARLALRALRSGDY